VLPVDLDDKSLVVAELLAERFASGREVARRFVEAIGGSQVAGDGERKIDSAFNISGTRHGFVFLLVLVAAVYL
jgi:hypothetical protein